MFKSILLYGFFFTSFINYDCRSTIFWKWKHCIDLWLEWARFFHFHWINFFFGDLALIDKMFSDWMLTRFCNCSRNLINLRMVGALFHYLYFAVFLDFLCFLLELMRLLNSLSVQ
jgi:hypothetical protein